MVSSEPADCKTFAALKSRYISAHVHEEVGISCLQQLFPIPLLFCIGQKDSVQLENFKFDSMNITTTRKKGTEKPSCTSLRQRALCVPRRVSIARKGPRKATGFVHAAKRASEKVGRRLRAEAPIPHGESGSPLVACARSVCETSSSVPGTGYSCTWGVGKRGR